MQPELERGEASDCTCLRELGGGEALITDVMHTSYSFFVPLSIIQYRDRVSEFAWGNASKQNRKYPLQIVPGCFNASKICITEGPIQVSVAHFVIP